MISPLPGMFGGEVLAHRSLSDKVTVVSDDGLAVRSGLRSAVVSSGLSQAGFARALGTSASRLSTYLSGGTVPSASWYLRAVRLGEGLRLARERSWLTPVAAMAGVRSALLEGDRVWALRLVLQCRDHLQAAFTAGEETASMVAGWEAAPGLAGGPEWDRLLAGLIGHEFEIRGCAVPVWTEQPRGESWVFGSPFFSEAEVRASTPAWLVGRGVFIADRDLVTA